MIIVLSHKVAKALSEWVLLSGKEIFELSPSGSNICISLRVFSHNNLEDNTVLKHLIVRQSVEVVNAVEVSNGQLVAEEVLAL